MRNRYRKRYNIINYHLMLLPAIIFLAVFSYYPLLGSILAFKEFQVKKGIWGSPWAGLEHFKLIFLSPKITQLLYNTVFISFFKMFFCIAIPLVFALLLNEVKRRRYKKSIQTIVFLPYFLSWVILAGMFKDIFSIDGVFNQILGLISGMKPVMFFASPGWFPWIIIFTDVWKSYGFNVIIFLASIASIDVQQYEAADMDGASRWDKISRITIPCITPTIILISTLSLQSILVAGFEQIFNLYNPLVYSTGDILDTYIYRMGIVNTQFEFATAIGLMKSAVSFILIYFTNKAAYKFANYRIF